MMLELPNEVKAVVDASLSVIYSFGPLVEQYTVILGK
jgi:hypothetical protein